MYDKTCVQGIKETGTVSLFEQTQEGTQAAGKKRKRFNPPAGTKPRPHSGRILAVSVITLAERTFPPPPFPSQKESAPREDSPLSLTARPDCVSSRTCSSLAARGHSGIRSVLGNAAQIFAASHAKEALLAPHAAPRVFDDPIVHLLVQTDTDTNTDRHRGQHRKSMP